VVFGLAEAVVEEIAPVVGESEAVDLVVEGFEVAVGLVVGETGVVAVGLAAVETEEAVGLVVEGFEEAVGLVVGVAVAVGLVAVGSEEAVDLVVVETEVVAWD